MQRIVSLAYGSTRKGIISGIVAVFIVSGLP